MSSSSTVLRIFVQLLKLFCHLTIIGMASLFITCLALFPGSTDGFMVLQYILNIMIIAANLYPSGSYSPHPHAVWFGINLFFTLLNWKKTYTDTIHGLVDNDVILEYLNPGHAERHLVLFSASVASWLVVFVLYMASLGLAKCLDILKKVANNKYVVNNVEDVTDEVQAKRNLAISALLKKLLKLLKKSLNRNIEIDVIV
jgi:hypothetical protein